MRPRNSKSFQFSLCGIKSGETVSFYKDDSIQATVVGGNKVKYKGHEYTLTGLAMMLTNKDYSVQGPRYFRYKGEILSELRKRLNKK